MSLKRDMEKAFLPTDELGFIYGIYEVSRSLLGITDLWFWNDQQIVPKEQTKLPGDYCGQGGNMVIPETGKNTHHCSRIAADMGLMLTHHHAEPLGAKMFSLVYPDLNPSYEEHPDKFKALWHDAIRELIGIQYEMVKEQAPDAVREVITAFIITYHFTICRQPIISRCYQTHRSS